MKKCCIFGALEPFGFERAALDGATVYAADRGLERLEKLGITPDYVIGDFDSLGYVPDPLPAEHLIKLPCEKDDTDIMSCVRHACERGAREFLIYGALGGRLDHTFANIQIMKRLAESGCRVTLYGDKYYAVAVNNGSITLEAKPGVRVSVFSLSDHANGVTLAGLKYPLADAKLDANFPLGVSNEFSERIACVSVECGTLLVLCDKM